MSSLAIRVPHIGVRFLSETKVTDDQAQALTDQLRRLAHLMIEQGNPRIVRSETCGADGLFRNELVFEPAQRTTPIIPAGDVH